ncbi:MAG: hypothetical protein JXQ93_11175 [Flavobacteriaceae bacterium]
MKIKTVEEPFYYKELFVEDSLIKHISSDFLNDSYVASVYEYNNREAGILVFRLKPETYSIRDLVNIEDEKSSFPSNRFYLGSIFKEELIYAFDTIKSLKSTKVLIDGYNRDFLKESNDSLVYLSFQTDKRISILFNNSESPSVFLDSAKSFSKKKIKTNILFLIKDDFLYVILSRPIKGNNIELLEKIKR